MTETSREVAARYLAHAREGNPASPPTAAELLATAQVAATLYVGDQLAALVERTPTRIGTVTVQAMPETHADAVRRLAALAEPQRGPRLPAVVEDRDGDLWDRVVESVDSYQMRNTTDARRLADLRDTYGPLHPAGTAL